MGFSGDLFLRVVWVRGTRRHPRRPNDGQLMAADTVRRGAAAADACVGAVTTDSRPHQRRSCAWCVLAQRAMAHFARVGRCCCGRRRAPLSTWECVAVQLVQKSNALTVLHLRVYYIM
jgi:hypothetical protein